MVSPVLLRCDGKQFGALGNLYAAAGKRAPLAVRRAVRRKGQKAHGLMTRAVRDRLRVKLREVRKRIRGRMIAQASYEIVARGRIPLKEFATVQDARGVKVDHVPRDWIDGAENLPKAFQAKRGKPSNQPGNAAKRRGTLGGRIVYGTGKRRREGFRSIGGVMVPSAFVDGRVDAEFRKVANELPAEIAHQLWVVVEGIDLKAASPNVRAWLAARGSAAARAD